MGFEEAVPPVPDRLSELRMLDRLEQTWLDQPNYRFYMQEDLRQTKMEYAKYNIEVKYIRFRQEENILPTASSSVF
jgi:hypothetical protein